MTWESIAATKRQALNDSIPAAWVIPAAIFPPEDQLDVATFPQESGFFTKHELEITSTPASTILSHLASGSWTSEEVTKAFCKTAAAAKQLTNCLSEIFFDRAITQAKELDTYFQETGKTKGPFHGLPISMKDNFNLVGYDSAIGFTSLANNPATHNSIIVDLLLEAGAVLYCKTNVPTAMMIPETVNNLLGRTVNPKNRNLTTGGSTGGEAALIAFGGSRIGVGSDIGGSLRMPAACTGLFTIRPSSGRFPNFQSRACLEGQESVNGVAGPMAKTLEEIVLWASVIVSQKPWARDPKCSPIPWRSVEMKSNKSLKIGVLWNDGFVTPTPPVARALKDTVELLKTAGHEVITWAPTEHMEMLGLLGRLFLADGGKSVRKLLEPTGEPFRPEMKPYEEAKELSVYDLWQVHLSRNTLCKSYLDRWNDTGIDAILCPTTPYSSVESGKFAYAGYTCVFNLLDYPVVSFPCGIKTDKAIDTAYVNHQALNDMDAQIQNDYSAEAVHGMPVSLQLVGRKLEEESLLAMTDLILKALESR
ncbi:amidase signature domain-containing protein [Aspergillus cavernicola]|uniref:Amidase signature domain-containing protein n=1 Tax=Aspergillus cavernicola TaxID=176166 RepID=A0ABR4IID6_9EURO